MNKLVSYKKIKSIEGIVERTVRRLTLGRTTIEVDRVDLPPQTKIRLQRTAKEETADATVPAKI